MKNRKTAWILLFAFVFLIGGAYLLYGIWSPEVPADQLDTQPPVSQDPQAPARPALPKAPDITVYDLEGNAVKLSDYFGKPIVMNFWASWCGPCQIEMPDFQEKYLELGGEIQFLMVNMTDGSRETLESASKFIAGKGYTFPVFYDTGLSAARTYSAYSLPATYFINTEGYVLARAVGAIDGQTLQRGIDMITGQG